MQAKSTVQRMQSLLAGIDPARVSQPGAAGEAGRLAGLRGQSVRDPGVVSRAFLRYYQWLDTGDPAACAWKDALGRYQTLKTEHLDLYDGDRDFPAYNFFAADIGMAHAQRAQAMAWLARLWLVLMLAMLLAGSGSWRGGLPRQGRPAHPGRR
ncbi:MAG: hypothetical protein R2844_20395 [Caldilineales bacterium]